LGNFPKTTNQHIPSNNLIIAAKRLGKGEHFTQTKRIGLLGKPIKGNNPTQLHLLPAIKLKQNPTILSYQLGIVLED
jgi:hypothetical protein